MAFIETITAIYEIYHIQNGISSRVVRCAKTDLLTDSIYRQWIYARTDIVTNLAISSINKNDLIQVNFAYGHYGMIYLGLETH